MMGDFHVRFRENVGVGFPCVTRITRIKLYCMTLNRIIIIFYILINCLNVNSQINKWQTPCIENEKKEGRLPLDYKIKRFPKSVDIEIRINKIEFGNDIYSFNFHYRNKIKYETDLLILNDTLGLRMHLAATTINKEKQYLYSINLYKMNQNCWRSLSTKVFSLMWAKQIPLSGGGVGYPGDKDFFRYVEGMIILHP